MTLLPILTLDELCPTSDITHGIDEGFNQDTQGPGTYLRVCRGELLPIAREECGTYSRHELLTPLEAQRAFERDPFITVLPVRMWYQSAYL